MKRTFILLFLLCSACRAEAGDGAISVTTKAWPTKITVGQEIRLLVDIDTSASVNPPSMQTNLSPFEIKTIEPMKTVSVGGRTHQQLTVVLTIFEVGKAVIPPLRLVYKDEAGHLGQIATDSIPVEVASVGKRKSDKDDIRPIKGPVSLNAGIIRVALCGIAAFFLTVFLIVKISLRRKQRLLDLESLKPAHERVGIELERLKKKAFLQDQKYKEFYSELSDILRRYLERRFDVQALELTTTEIITLLKSRDFDKTVLDEIRDVLENADLVKFARFNAPRDVADRLQTELMHIAEATKPVEVKNAV